MKDLSYINKVFEDFKPPNIKPYSDEVEEITNKIDIEAENITNLESDSKDFLTPVGNLVGYKDRLSSINSILDKDLETYKICLDISEQHCNSKYSEYESLKQNIEICRISFLILFFGSLITLAICIFYSKISFTELINDIMLCISIGTMLAVTLIHLIQLIFLKNSMKKLESVIDYDNITKDDISKTKEVYLSIFKETLNDFHNVINTKIKDINKILKVENK